MKLRSINPETIYRCWLAALLVTMFVVLFKLPSLIEWACQ